MLVRVARACLSRPCLSESSLLVRVAHACLSRESGPGSSVLFSGLRAAYGLAEDALKVPPDSDMALPSP